MSPNYFGASWFKQGDARSDSLPKICKKYVFKVDNIEHPGIVLLPPKDIISFPTLPASVIDQISYDGTYYDYYGKLGFAFEDSLIDAPQGKAKKDFENWLSTNPDIRDQINEIIRVNWDRICLKEEDEVEIEPIEGFTEDDMKQLKKLTSNYLFAMAPSTVPRLTYPGYEQPPPYRGFLGPDLLAILDMRAEDWSPGKNLKEDRSRMYAKILAVLRDTNMSLFGKAAAILLAIMQYIHKSR